MKISYNWLREFIELTETPDQISAVLTETGLEVEGLEKVEKIQGGFAGLVVGEILTCTKHPNADKLSVTTVDIGTDHPSPIVCGAPNVAIGQKVIVATVSAKLYPISGDPFVIKKAKIRGELSEGMICAEDEIGLGTGHDGIMVLATEAPNGTPVSDLFDNGEDFIFEIGLTPNRGDATSHLGTARDLAAYYQRPINMPSFKEVEQKTAGTKIFVENSEACPRYSGVNISGIKVEPSPEWLQFRLRAIGQEPINNIVDITNYVMHHLGQPLHAFDASKIKENTIIVKTLSEGTKFTTLDEKERKLHPNDLMICDAEKGMCMAGVFGGLHSGVSDSTQTIFLESAYFHADWVRGTTTRHSLSTDAAFRFERGTDPEMTLIALQFAANMILDIAGGQIASNYQDIYPHPIRPVQIISKFDTYHRLIGETLPNERIITILNDLDIRTKEVTHETFTAVVPPFRSEVTREADLVEEVLRIYGINNISIDDHFSTGYLAEFKEIEPYKLQESISIGLAGKGFHEMITNSITNMAYETKMGFGGEHTVSLLNPSSVDLNIMRPSMLYTGLESLRYNINRKQNELKYFEFGKTYHKPMQYQEKQHLMLYQTGKKQAGSWLEGTIDTSIYHLLESVYQALELAGINSTITEPLTEDPNYEYGLSISFNRKLLGTIGKLKNEICSHYQIDQDIFSADLNWDAIVASASREQYYKPISKFPEVKRDLSLVLDKRVTYKEVQDIAFKQERKLLNRMNVFNVYEGDKIEKGKKAYAITFYLQDNTKTLNDKQIDKTMSRLMSLFENELNAIIRR
ncbi:MAG: phenylalanyl-tRNA synthetase beta chain [Cyclobacteriaceae bacterium]|jgi:phenylalanyl-tRNA synthetase beta chain